MKKFVMLGILLWALMGMAQAVPSLYTIAGKDPNLTINVDGNLSEWPEAYFVDSLHSDDNIYAEDVGTQPWTRNDFQYMVYAAHDDTKFYLGLKLIQDDVIILGSHAGCDDGFKMIPGGKANGFYVYFDGTIYLNPSCAFANGATLFAALLPNGNGTFPTVEISLDKAVMDPFSLGVIQFSVGFEEGDTPYTDCNNTMYGAIGAFYQGFKQDWNSNPWDNPQYYPTFTLGPVVPIKAESKVTAKTAEMLMASPNPFMPATTLSYNVKNSGSLKIYDMTGKVIKSFAVKAGTGSVEWNADGMASGIYVARLISGKSTLNTRLFLTR